jgi:hypothetical protein
MRIIGFVLADEDVSAPGPSVETGAGVPSYSGGVAACVVVLYSDLLNHGSLTPVAMCRFTRKSGNYVHHKKLMMSILQKISE